MLQEDAASLLPVMHFGQGLRTPYGDSNRRAMHCGQ